MFRLYSPYLPASCNAYAPYYFSGGDWGWYVDYDDVPDWLRGIAYSSETLRFLIRMSQLGVCNIWFSPLYLFFSRVRVGGFDYLVVSSFLVYKQGKFVGLFVGKEFWNTIYRGSPPYTYPVVHFHDRMFRIFHDRNFYTYIEVPVYDENLLKTAGSHLFSLAYSLHVNRVRYIENLFSDFLQKLQDGRFLFLPPYNALPRVVGDVNQKNTLMRLPSKARIFGSPIAHIPTPSVISSSEFQRIEVPKVYSLFRLQMANNPLVFSSKKVYAIYRVPILSFPRLFPSFFVRMVFSVGGFLIAPKARMFYPSDVFVPDDVFLRRLASVLVCSKDEALRLCLNIRNVLVILTPLVGVSLGKLRIGSDLSFSFASEYQISHRLLVRAVKQSLKGKRSAFSVLAGYSDTLQYFANMQYVYAGGMMYDMVRKRVRL